LHCGSASGAGENADQHLRLQPQPCPRCGVAMRIKDVPDELNSWRSCRRRGEEERVAVQLEAMQIPGLEVCYLKGVLPLVAQVKLGMTWAETH
jgi:hypothetical protein